MLEYIFGILLIFTGYMSYLNGWEQVLFVLGVIIFLENLGVPIMRKDFDIVKTKGIIGLIMTISLFAYPKMAVPLGLEVRGTNEILLWIIYMPLVGISLWLLSPYLSRIMGTDSKYRKR